MPARPITENTLFYGDNLRVLREYIPGESVDLIYLDPVQSTSSENERPVSLLEEQEKYLCLINIVS